MYEPIHPPDALNKHLHPSKHLGEVAVEAAQTLDEERKNRRKTKDEIRIEEAHKRKPPLSRILSLYDMEVGLSYLDRNTFLFLSLNHSIRHRKWLARFYPSKLGHTTLQQQTRKSVGMAQLLVETYN